MAQHSHVPKFGNWDRENVPYTMYFENARKEKTEGIKFINPNDPEQNPNAFSYGLSDHGTGVKQQHRRRSSRDDDAPQTRMTAPDRNNSTNYRTGSDPQRTRHVRSGTSDSGSERSNSDRSIMQSHHQRRRSGQGRISKEGSGSFTPSPPMPTRSKNGNTRRAELPRRVPSVPKFGAWDESDPKSGDGFTVIFNKVKEEKHAAIPAAPVGYPSAHGDQPGSSPPKPKSCCCFFK